MNKKTQRLALSGVMLALAAILSFVTVYRLPYGGSITPASMLPVLFVGYIYGVKWGVLTGCIYGVIQALLGAVTSAAFAGLDVFSVIAVCVLDFLVAFGVLGLAGAFKRKVKPTAVAFGAGILLATLLRYAAHFVSGCIVYGSYAEWFFGQREVPFGSAVLNAYSGKALAAVYSLVYNGTYMVPEIIISVVVGVILINVPQIKEICRKGG